jgi:hypothetical protein
MPSTMRSRGLKPKCSAALEGGLAYLHRPEISRGDGLAGSIDPNASSNANAVHVQVLLGQIARLWVASPSVARSLTIPGIGLRTIVRTSRHIGAPSSPDQAAT